MPNANNDTRLATAFHRNTLCNTKGGTDEEEFRTLSVIDRINTTWEVWQGVSMGCVQCHSHPYDPIRHNHYYKFMVFEFVLDSKLDAKKEGSLHTLYLGYFLEFKGISKENPNKTPREQALMDCLNKFQPTRVPVIQAQTGKEKRITHVFERGNWLSKGKEVAPDVPELWNPKKRHFNNRQDLANWMVSDENPLTARVAVNRIWEQLFGYGLVETLEDFGSQGAKPSHPELLDFLALKFRDDFKWDIKKMLSYILSSATYQQTSVASKELIAKDPRNYYLARGPRLRLTGEQVRDVGLAVSGKLSTKMFGPPVLPPQPPGVWNTVYSGLSWKTASGEDAFRRSIYTWWRRTSPYPSMIMFDAPSRDICVSRRIRTNTPLQALVTLNDTVYLTFAQGLAQQMLATEGGAEEQIKFGYFRAIGKQPDGQSLKRLEQLYQKGLQNFSQKPEDAKAYAGHPEGSPSEAAMTLVASAIMNLDAYLTKE